MRGLLSSGHPLISEAGADILRAGGNAFDAVVAAAFTSTFAEPTMASLGGAGFVLARTSSGEEILFDFIARAPGLGLSELPADGERHFYPVDIFFGDVLQEFTIGRASAAVPGTLKGLVHVHRRLGRLPLAEVVAPAIAAARGGMRVTRFGTDSLQLMYPVLRDSPAGTDLYLENGEVLAPGTLHRNPDLADFLEALPRDPRGFYGGDFAAAVERDMLEGGGLMTREDLARYEVVERRPLSIEYRGRRVLANPPPALGGTLMTLRLLLQGETDLRSCVWGSRAHVRCAARALERAVRLRAGEAAARDPAQARLLEAVHTPSIHAVQGTTHLNASDAEGNVAALSMSNGSGSSYFLPGTGIHFNNMMGEVDLHPAGLDAGEPGDRVASMMSPALLLEGDQVLAALGTGGSNRIPSAVSQVVSSLLDFDLSPDEAANFPRMHFDGERLQVEPGFPEEALAALREEWDVSLWSRQNLYFGGVHVVAPRAGRVGADRRREGHGIVVR